MQQIRTNINGISTQSSYPDGTAYSLVNLRPKNGALHPVPPRKLVQELSQKYDIVFVHQNNDYKNWIGVVNNSKQNTVRTLFCPVTDYLIKEKKNHVFSDVTFNKLVKEICKKAGINKKIKVKRGGVTEVGEKWEFVSSHTARRSFATNIYLKVWDILLVSELMGHSDVKVTQTYLCCPARKNNLAMEYVNQFMIAA